MSDSVDQPLNEHMPSKHAMIFMRIIATLALGLALFLLTISISIIVAGSTPDIAMCGGASWIDCKTVLESKRFASFLTVIPVSALAAVIYGTLAFTLFWMDAGQRQTALQKAWIILHIGAAAITLAAIWFVFVQIYFIEGTFCVYCLIEHLLGVILAFAIFAQGKRVRIWPQVPRAAASVAGVGMVLVLIVSQIVINPSIAETIPTGNYADDAPPSTDKVTDKTQTPGDKPVKIDYFGDWGTKSHRYSEELYDLPAVSVAQGYYNFSRYAHPILGNKNAKYVAVEVVDYTCPACKRLHDLLKAAKEDLGDDYAVMVFTFPLQSACNDHLPNRAVLGGSSGACALAVLAHRVFIVKPEKFEQFHNFLFDNQAEIKKNISMAFLEAERLAGKIALNKDDVMELARKIVRKRDTFLGRKMIIKETGGIQLPGLLTFNHRLSAKPDNAAALVKFLKEGFEK